MDEITLHILGTEFGILVLLVAVAILAAVAGYYRGKRKGAADSKHQPANPPDSYSAFLQGIHYILANETDQAIEALSRAVKINSETIETYVALGNLYRAKGEIDRAIRIRQSLLLRPKVDPDIKLQALFDLGKDYKQGGFLHRAISTFEEVIRRAPKRLDAYKELESLCEATRDWQRAYELQKEIGKLSNTNEQPILAHLQTEQAKGEMKKGNLDSAKGHLKKALTLDFNCVDARLHLGELYWLKNRRRKALSIWKKLVQNNSQWAHLVLSRLEESDGESGDEARLMDFLESIAREDLKPRAKLALARCFLRRNRKEQAILALRGALELDPHLQEARRLLGEALLEDDDQDDALNQTVKRDRHGAKVQKPE